jgi:ATP-dependent DNA helicase RecQ
MQSSSSTKAGITIQVSEEQSKELTKSNLPLTIAMFRLRKLMRGRKSYNKQVQIDLSKWRSECKMPLDKFNSNLEKLQQLNIITCKLKKPSYLTKVLKKVPYDSFNLRMNEIDEREAYLKAQKNSLMSYVSSSHICRSKYILNYFDEQVENDCGKCDVCLSKK